MERFSGRRLRAMMLPLFVEQLLVMLVGLTDTLMVSHAGEAAVSGVALVNQFNIIFLYLFLALASGGAVVISQYIGRKENEQAGRTASQLLLLSIVISLAVTGLVLSSAERLLSLLFGRVEPEVMAACVRYLQITACGYPAIAVYYAGAAICRSLGKNSITMYITALACVLNAVGDFLGIFVLQAGVAGVAWPFVLAWGVSAVLITLVCFGKAQAVTYRISWILAWNGALMRRILSIAIPNGIESGVFQLVKVALTSMAALFGTYQIAANGVAQSIWSLAALAGVAMGPVFITVIGQCVGARDLEAAAYYFRKLGRYTLAFSTGWNILILAITPFVLDFYALAPETKKLVLLLVLIHNVFNAGAFPYSGAFSNGLRAAGDVRFTMTVSLASTIGGRLLLSYVLGIVLNMGVIGLALAMAADWTIRAVVFLWRERTGEWRNFQVI